CIAEGKRSLDVDALQARLANMARMSQSRQMHHCVTACEVGRPVRGSTDIAEGGTIKRKHLVPARAQCGHDRLADKSRGPGNNNAHPAQPSAWSASSTG